MAELNVNRLDKNKTEKALKRKGTDEFVLHLYVANRDFKSVQAIKNIEDICEKNIPGRYQLDIIDICQQPALARKNQIVAAPTLIKELPPPISKLVGSMSDEERVLVGLDLRSMGEESKKKPKGT